MLRYKHNPFEGLEEFSTLDSLINFILDSVSVSEIKVRMYGDYKTLTSDPLAILPIGSINDIIVGNATFQYIRHRAGHVMENVKERIQKIINDSTSSFEDRFKEFEAQKKKISRAFQYFNSMNLIRYMTGYQWGIIVSEMEDDKQIDKVYPWPSSSLELKKEDWRNIQDSFSIRRDLLSEIIYLIDQELEKLKDSLADTQYGWVGNNWKYEITEIILALLGSGKIDIQKGSQETFIHDFLSFFGKTDEEFAYSRGKILGRTKRSIFLSDLQTSLEKYGKTTQEKMTL